MAKISKEKLHKTKVVATRSIIAILCVVFGILISAQWRSLPDRVTNPIAPYASLKETKEALYAEQSQLKGEIVELQKTIAQTQKDSLDISLTKSELADLKTKKAQAGLLKLNGAGVIITLDDSKTSPTSEDSIVHAADLRDVANLLWSSGAEAISINGQRVVANTAIDCIVNTILVNNNRLTAPFTIEAIGDQNYLFDIISNQDILSSIHQRQKDQGLIFNVTQNNDITMPVFDGSFEVKAGGS